MKHGVFADWLVSLMNGIPHPHHPHHHSMENYGHVNLTLTTNSLSKQKVINDPCYQTPPTNHDGSSPSHPWEMASYEACNNFDGSSHHPHHPTSIPHFGWLSEINHVKSPCALPKTMLLKHTFPHHLGINSQSSFRF